LKFISDILVDEFNIAIDFNYLESDLLDINSHYNKNDGSCFWVVESKNDSQIIGTVVIRNLQGFTSDEASAVSEIIFSKIPQRFRIGRQMVDTAIDFAKRMGHTIILLHSSKKMNASRDLYLKNGFIDIHRYNKNNHRADIFMEKKL
jgi:GNAT superfamily N-acetyltransferase